MKSDRRNSCHRVVQPFEFLTRRPEMYAMLKPLFFNARSTRPLHSPMTHSLATSFAVLAVCTALGACQTRDKTGTVVDSSAGSLSATKGASMSATNSMKDSMAAMNMPAKAAPEQQLVLDELGMLGGKPIETLSATEARKQPSPADAVTALLKKEGKSTAPEAVGSVVNRTIPSADGSIPVRVYTPIGAGPFPIIVYYHGGGFVIATNDTYDASARALTNAVNAVLVSVEYRKAPEHKFPAAHDDALAAYKWVLANGATLHGDVARIAVAGESAGGNLALATTLTARASGIKLPVAILAVYPVAGNDTNTASYRENANAKPLNRAMMSWFFKQYTRTPADAEDSRLNILGANLKGLPPTTIITAQLDPLRTDGEMLASKLRDAGVTVDYKNFDGAAHEFFGQGAVQPLAKQAVQFAASGLKNALKN